MDEAPHDPDRLMSWPDLLERKRPEPDATIRYGDQINIHQKQAK